MKHHALSREVFIIAFIIECALLIYAIAVKPGFIFDCVFGLIFIALLYILEETYPLPLPVIILGLVPIYLHSAGVLFGLFSMMFFGIGYDKYVHFTNSFIIAFVVFFFLIAHSKSNAVKKGIAALLIAQGFGAINEVNEFVGSEYLGITGPTMFSQGDELPPLKHDFITFDSYWDMIFNLCGSILAMILISILWHTQVIAHPKSKKPEVVL